MAANTEDTLLRSLDRTITLIRDDLSVVHGLKRVQISLFDHLFGAFPQRVPFHTPPPRYVLIDSVRGRGFEHEQRHEFETKRFALAKPRVVERVEIDELRLLEPSCPIPVVALPAGPEGPPPSA